MVYHLKTIKKKERLTFFECLLDVKTFIHCGRKNNEPLQRWNAYATRYGKKDFTDVIKITDLEMGRVPETIHVGPI